MRKTYRSKNGRISGGVRLYCPCCNYYGKHPRNMKKFTRRAYRRVHRNDGYKEMAE